MILSRTGNGYVIKGSCILVLPVDGGWHLRQGQWHLRQGQGWQNRQWLETHGLESIVFPTLQSLRQLLQTLPPPPHEETYTRLTVVVDGERYSLKRVRLVYEVAYIVRVDGSSYELRRRNGQYDVEHYPDHFDEGVLFAAKTLRGAIKTLVTEYTHA